MPRRSNKWPIVSSVPHIQQKYEDMRAAGESHNIADMLAHQKGPQLETDTMFSRGFAIDPFGCNPEPLTVETYLGEARRAGVSTTCKRYMSSLAAYPGDPEAWVDSKGDVRRVCEKRGWGCEGKVNVTARPKPKSGAKEKRFI